MKKYRHGGLSTGLLIILLAASGGQVCAGPDSGQVTYSHDYWPSRWSSAIRQQQTARFPTRVEEKVILEELPETVQEQDLFFSPSLNSRFDQGNRTYNYGQRGLKHRFSRNSGQSNRDAAFAYQSSSGPAPSNYGGSAYGPAYGPTYGYPTARPMPSLPGYPGTGFQMMPGVPGAYPMNIGPYGGAPYGGMPYGGAPYGGMPYGGVPYGGMPYGGMPYGGVPFGFGFPGNMAMWNPPFGAW